MHAGKGDHVTVPGRHVGDPERHGEVLEIRGPDGGPPYLIRWDNGHERLVCPGAEMRFTAGTR
ncbi:MAG: DUF1918 domain-containing protein [Mycobacteriales bacterium]